MPVSSTASAKRGPADAGLLLALCLGLATQASAASLYGLSLDRLDAKQALALGDYQGKVLLLTFFEPECAWCHRQLKTLEHLSERCDDALQPMAVGINGRDDALRKELRRARVSFPGAKANAALIKLVGTVPATPWTLVVTPDGEFAAKLRGFVREESLAAAFPSLCPADAVSD